MRHGGNRLTSWPPARRRKRRGGGRLRRKYMWSNDTVETIFTSSQRRVYGPGLNPRCGTSGGKAGVDVAGGVGQVRGEVIHETEILLAGVLGRHRDHVRAGPLGGQRAVGGIFQH